MNYRMILLASAGMSLSNTAYAQTAEQCTIAPTCAELGYEQKAADCNGQRSLKCPFDQTKVFCGGTACSEDFKLTACDSSLGTCAECGGKYKYTACNSGWTLSSGNCIANDCPGYTLSSCPSSAMCLSCKSGNTTKYKYRTCPDGYYLDSGGCQRYCTPSLSELGPYSGYTTFVDKGRTCYVATGCTNGREPCTDLYGECPEIGYACMW